MASSRKPSGTDELPAALTACLTRHVQPGQQLVVGLSGGVDSISLLHVLASQSRDAGWTLAALHVHHGLSPHADEWESFCREICSRWRVPFRCVRVAVERSSADGLEGAARRARHAAFAAAAGDWILLAQHRNDQAETVLFNLLRGAGLSGAAAMRERNGRLLRPWLDIGREAIEAYAAAQGLVWIEDESNADLRHSRNFLRQKIIPELQGRFPAAVRNLAAASQRFAGALELLDELAQNDLGAAANFPLEMGVLVRLSEARACNALRYLLACRQVMIPSEARLREALRQMREAAPDRHPALEFGRFRLVRRRGRVHLESDDSR